MRWKSRRLPSAGALYYWHLFTLSYFYLNFFLLSLRLLKRRLVDLPQESSARGVCLAAMLMVLGSFLYYPLTDVQLELGESTRRREKHGEAFFASFVADWLINNGRLSLCHHALVFSNHLLSSSLFKELQKEKGTIWSSLFVIFFKAFLLRARLARNELRFFTLKTPAPSLIVTALERPFQSFTSRRKQAATVSQSSPLCSYE